MATLRETSDKTAMEHDSPEALKKYLHDHPNADKSNHSVKKQVGFPSTGKETFTAMRNGLIKMVGRAKTDAFNRALAAGMQEGGKKRKDLVADLAEKHFGWKSDSPKVQDLIQTVDHLVSLVSKERGKTAHIGGNTMATLRDDLIKLGTTNPELRPHIRPILAGCEKLPEGGMRDNCEAKKEEGGEKKEANLFEQELIKLGTTNPELRPHIRPLLKMAGRGVTLSMDLRTDVLDLLKANQMQDAQAAQAAFYGLLQGMATYSYFVLGSTQMRMLLVKAAEQMDRASGGVLSAGETAESALI